MLPAETKEQIFYSNSLIPISQFSRGKADFYQYHSILIFRCNLPAHLLCKRLCDRETQPRRFCRGGFHGVEAVEETACLDFIKLRSMVCKDDFAVLS